MNFKKAFDISVLLCLVVFGALAFSSVISSPTQLSATVGVFLDTPSNSASQQVTCTADAYQCPDGTVVGRTSYPGGPSCVFVCPSSQTITPPTTCSQEAKICPDGSAVSRTGPNCEFAACPVSPIAPPVGTPPRTGIEPQNTPNTSNTPVVECTIDRTLSVGATGAGVSCLQQLLARDSSVYPEGLVTGYFGPLTLRALQTFQARQGIVSSGDAYSTGYGLAGPRTRAALLGY